MALLVPAIHVVTWRVRLRTRSILSHPRVLYLETRATHAGVDGRDKPDHDGTGAFSSSNFVTWAYLSAYGPISAVPGLSMDKPARDDAGARPTLLRSERRAT
jgi:hypothetical protein